MFPSSSPQSSSSQSKFRTPHSSLLVFCRRHGSIVAISLLLFLAFLSMLRSAPSSFHSQLPPSPPPPYYSPPYTSSSSPPADDLLSDLSTCQSHLAEAEASASSALDSARRTHQALEDLAARAKSPEPGAASISQIGVPKYPDCPSCPSPSALPELPQPPPPPPSNGASKRWLTVGIPTVARDEDHLGNTIESWLRQLPLHPDDPLFNQVLLVVMNMTPEKEHSWFETAKVKYAAGHPMSSYIIFTSNDTPSPNPLPHLQDAGSSNTPGYRVRKQTRDIVALMRASERHGNFYLFTEDDMELCDHALMAMQYLLNKAERYSPDFMTIRASYGMNGIFMRDEDMEDFGIYLLEHQARRPPDHLVVEWFAGEKPQSAALKRGRGHLAFRYNILDHKGVVSSLRAARSKSFPKCYEELGEPTLFEVEAFDFKQCGDDDVWPCDVNREVTKTSQIAWGKMCTGSICLNPGNVESKNQ